MESLNASLKPLGPGESKRPVNIILYNSIAFQRNSTASSRNRKDKICSINRYEMWLVVLSFTMADEDDDWLAGSFTCVVPLKPGLIIEGGQRTLSYTILSEIRFGRDIF